MYSPVIKESIKQVCDGQDKLLTIVMQGRL